MQSPVGFGVRVTFPHACAGDDPLSGVERRLDARSGPADDCAVRGELPTGTVTLLFSDVEGSTTLLHELGAEAYADALAEHRRIVRAACAAEGGVEVDTQGDAFFFAFRSAPAALAAAQAVTGAFAAGRIRVRIGVHTGTPLVTEEGYVGDDVHLAARVGASGHGGQVVLSQTTRELVDGLQLTDLGEHRLKDIPGAVSIFQLGSERFPPLKTISNTNLPRPASSFIGRERELRELLAAIRSARLVTLTGPGGSGKTRLALDAAATLVPDYKAGVFWVGLATLRDPALVSETIGQTLGAKNGLAEHIGERELLLLLDNLEQVIEAAPQLPALLSACANLTVLVTSRELLRVQGEVEYAVPPLASPEAVTLFCERSRLEPSDEIAELCARLDELPLAVELAAARAKALSPRQILERLSQRLDLLEGGRDADPRQQTLRATIDWSYDLLSEEEQRVVRALSSSPAAAPWTPPKRSAALASARCSRWSRRACSVSRTSATGCSRRFASMRTAGRCWGDRSARPPPRRLPPRAPRGAATSHPGVAPAGVARVVRGRGGQPPGNPRLSRARCAA
jgi:class 3 adenylate cyclase